MYEAKRTGKGRAVLYHPGLRESPEAAERTGESGVRDTDQGQDDLRSDLSVPYRAGGPDVIGDTEAPSSEAYGRGRPSKTADEV